MTCMPSLVLFGQRPPSFDDRAELRACYAHMWSTYAGTDTPHERFLEDLKTAAESGHPIVKVMLSHSALQDEGFCTIAAVLSLLPRFGHPTEVVLSHNTPGVRGLRAVLSVSNNSNISVIELFQCGLGDADCAVIAEVLCTNPSLQRLKLGDNDITDAGVAVLCDGVADNMQMVQLHLGGNDVGDAGMRHIARSLFGHISVTSLGLRNVGIGDAGVAVIAEALAASSCRLQEVNLRLNPFSSKSSRALGGALAQNTSLRHLDASSCKISSGLRQLSVGIASSQLTELSLCGNVLADEGVVVLCRALHERRSRITVLLLDEVGLTSAGVSAVASLVHASPHLKILSLKENCLGDGACLLARALAGSRLESLNVTQCGILPQGSASFALGLRTNTSLTALDHASNSTGASGVMWASALAVNKTLTRLSLTDNEIPGHGVRAIELALSSNSTLRGFNFGGQSAVPPVANRVPSSCRVAINKQVQANRTAHYTATGDAGGDCTPKLITNAVLCCLKGWLKSDNIDVEESLVRHDVRPHRRALGTLSANNLNAKRELGKQR